MIRGLQAAYRPCPYMEGGAGAAEAVITKRDSGAVRAGKDPQGGWARSSEVRPKVPSWAGTTPLTPPSLSDSLYNRKLQWVTEYGLSRGLWKGPSVQAGSHSVLASSAVL